MTNENPVAPVHLDITLEDYAMVNEIKKALMLIKGISSIRITHEPNENVITPSLAKKIAKARKEYAQGNYTECKTPQELTNFLNAL